MLARILDHKTSAERTNGSLKKCSKISIFRRVFRAKPRGLRQRFIQQKVNVFGLDIVQRLQEENKDQICN